jgi:hypothetical protein
VHPFLSIPSPLDDPDFDCCDLSYHFLWTACSSIIKIRSSKLLMIRGCKDPSCSQEMKQRDTSKDNCVVSHDEPHDSEHAHGHKLSGCLSSLLNSKMVSAKGLMLLYARYGR